MHAFQTNRHRKRVAGRHRPHELTSHASQLCEPGHPVTTRATGRCVLLAPGLYTMPSQTCQTSRAGCLAGTLRRWHSGLCPLPVAHLPWDLPQGLPRTAISAMATRRIHQGPHLPGPAAHRPGGASVGGGDGFRRCRSRCPLRAIALLCDARVLVRYARRQTPSAPEELARA